MQLAVHRLSTLYTDETALQATLSGIGSSLYRRKNNPPKNIREVSCVNKTKGDHEVSLALHIDITASFTGH